MFTSIATCPLKIRPWPLLAFIFLRRNVRNIIKTHAGFNSLFISESRLAMIFVLRPSITEVTFSSLTKPIPFPNLTSHIIFGNFKLIL